MRIDFRIRTDKPKEVEHKEEFCQFIVDSMKKDIITSAVLTKIQLMLDKAIDMIDWQKKPDKMHAIYYMSLITDSITYSVNRDGTYSILINETRPLPNANTTIGSLARFIDKGNDEIKGTYMYSKVFNEYSENISTYWESYIAYVMNHYGIKNSFVIKGGA